MSPSRLVCLSSPGIHLSICLQSPSCHHEDYRLLTSFWGSKSSCLQGKLFAKRTICPSLTIFFPLLCTLGLQPIGYCYPYPRRIPPSQLIFPGNTQSHLKVCLINAPLTYLLTYLCLHCVCLSLCVCICSYAGVRGTTYRNRIQVPRLGSKHLHQPSPLASPLSIS